MSAKHGGPRPNSGRPKGSKNRTPRVDGARHKRGIVLDDETLAIWNSIKGDKSAWLRIVMATTTRTYQAQYAWTFQVVPEVPPVTKWLRAPGGEWGTLEWCRGYLAHVELGGQAHPPYRIVRPDGQVVEELAECTEEDLPRFVPMSGDNATTQSDEDHEIAASVVGWLNSWEPRTYEGQRVDDDTDEGQALLDRLDAARVRLRDHIAKRAGLTEPGRYFWDDDL